MYKIVHQGQMGAAIRQLRRDKGWTQQDLAEKAGVSVVWLSHAERGKRSVQIDLVFKVLECLGKSVSIDDPPEDLLALVLPPDRYRSGQRAIKDS